jgi:hypothetical protein
LIIVTQKESHKWGVFVGLFTFCPWIAVIMPLSEGEMKEFRKYGHFIQPQLLQCCGI